MKLFFLILLFVTASSCSKYLDRKSDESQATLESVSDLQAFLSDDMIMNRGFPAEGNASSDDYFILPEVYDTRDEMHQQVYTWRPYAGDLTMGWGSAYKAVFNANFCLDNIDKASLGASLERDRANVKGSAYFYRGFHLLGLCWDYAKAYDEATADVDLGVVLRLGSDFNVASVRSTVRESYQQVISDAMQSLLYLPAFPSHPNRPSVPAAYGLLARTYLSMRKYDSAFKYADKCLAMRSDLMDYNSDESINGTIANTPPFVSFNREVIYNSHLNSISLTSSSRARVDTLLYDSFGPDDLRKVAFFSPLTIHQRFKGSYAGPTLFAGIAVDEIFLIRSECSAKLGNIQAAMDDLNTLLVKRWENAVPYVPLAAATEEEAISLIRAERRKELLNRGLRWPDLKRYNLEGANITLTRKIRNEVFTLEPNSPRYALPIPSDIVQITGIPQN